jgi:hypothetical protein
VRDPVARPPRIVTVAVVAALATLLVYPLHRRYLYPEQDVPIGAAMMEFSRGGWEPFVLVYPSALTNLLRVGDEGLFAVGWRAGWWRERGDLVAAWAREPWRLRFRLPPRLLAAAAGLAALLAAADVAALCIPGWTFLAAPIVLGTSLGFVREFHHGMYDAPAAGTAMVACALATRWLVRSRRLTIMAAAAAAALAAAFKYNLAVAAFPVACAFVTAPSRTSLGRAAMAALVAGVVVFVAAMPVVVLDPVRLFHELRGFAPRQLEILRSYAPPGGFGVVASLTLGFGWTAGLLAVGGMARAVRRRERLLVPLGAFTLAYGILLATTPLVLNRYSVPLAPPLAVFAAYAIAALPRVPAAIVTLALAGLALPSSLAHVRLLGIEDTRVGAARWIERHGSPARPVLIAGNPGSAMYSAPDLPPRLPIPGAAEPSIAWVEPPPGDPNDVRRLAGVAGRFVVTTEHPSPRFARASTPAETVALLERHARIVLDLPIERVPDPARVYEPFDLNYLPFTGLGTLARPGPHIRIWQVPDAP